MPQHFLTLLRSNFHSDPFFFASQLLIVGIVVAMTRAFALVSFFEVILVFLFVLHPGLRREFIQTLKDPRVFMVIAFWGWVAIAMLWGVATLEERLEEWWSWRKLLLVPMCFVLFKDVRAKVAFLWTLVGICSVYMIFSWLGHLGFVTLDRSPAHLLENHSTQGILFAGACIAGLGLAQYHRGSWKLWLLVILLGIGFISNIILVSTGRSAYLSLITIAAVSSFMFVSRHRISVLAFAVVFSSSFLYFSDNSRSRIYQAVDEAIHAFDDDSSYTSLGVRVVMWKTTLEMIKNSPVLGSGSGSFHHDYGEISKEMNGWRSLVSDDPHQQYLHIAAEQGFVGLIIFLIIPALFLRSQMKADNRIFLIIGYCVLLSTVMTSMANGHFNTFVEGRFVWISISILFAGTAIQSLSKDPRRGMADGG
jgi:O-antigen ligase